MPEPPSDMSACENCQTSDRTVTFRRTPSGRGMLCASCYTGVLTGTRLSPREAEVYAYSDSGYTNEDIAAELDLDASTVASHLANVRQKYAQAVQLADIIEPVSTTSTQSIREFDGDVPPEGLDPGVVVKLDAPNVDSMEPGTEYTHGIVRRVLTRSNAGIPTRVAVYPINPSEGIVRTDSRTGMPAVIDNHTKFTEVVFPNGVLLKDLPDKI